MGRSRPADAKGGGLLLRVYSPGRGAGGSTKRWRFGVTDLGLELNSFRAASPVGPVLTLAVRLSPRRMKDVTKKNLIFAQFRKSDRDKQKLIETVVRQLRGLVNGLAQQQQHP